MGDGSFPAKTTRCLMFTVHLMTMIGALSLIVIALLVEFSFFRQNHFFSTATVESPPLIFAFLLAVVWLISCIGCVGVTINGRWVLIFFSVLMAILMVVEAAAGVYGFLKMNEVQTLMKDKMQASMKDYTKVDTITRSWDVLQYDFNCCGIENNTDWSGIAELPHSCCHSIGVREICTMKDASKIGCLTVVKDFIAAKTCPLIISVVGVILAQMGCIIGSCWLAGYIKRKYEAV